MSYTFSQLVLNWYHVYGRKNLPWQKKKTLYTVWISEIMLQQTTVKTVIPYFQKFIKKFPNIQTLNNNKLDDVLHMWSGLGYYKRAENIYKSAVIIKKYHQEKFPKEFMKVISLPGIGRSTAGAILSLSLNYFFPILEGNVKRILIRYYGMMECFNNKTTEQKLWHLISDLTPLYNTGKFNQGIMDIGALVCTPNNPKCNICPLHETCIAYKNQKWNKYIIHKLKKKKSKKESWFVILKYKKQFWIEKNVKKNIWHNLFCFPNFKNKKIMFEWLKKNQIPIDQIKNMQSINHKFSHFQLHINLILIECLYNVSVTSRKNIGIWYNLDQPKNIGLPKPVQDILTIFNK